MGTIGLKLKRWMTVLFLVAAAGLLPAASIPAAAAGNKGDLILIYLAPLTPPRPMCKGETKYYPVTVDSLPGRQYISGATITLNGKTAGTTGLGGSTRVSYQFKKTGPFTLTIGATKSGYTDANPEVIEGEVIECGWKMRMWYEETVRMPGSNFFEAECYFKFPNQTFVRDENDQLVLTTGKSTISAQYGCDTGGWEWPIKVSMTPTVEGSMEVNFKGQYVKGSLQITLTAVGGALPEQVQIHVEDVAQGGGKTPPVTWVMYPHADVINKANVNNWAFNPVFDYKIYQAPKSLFWPEQGLTFSGGEAYFIVELDKPSN